MKQVVLIIGDRYQRTASAFIREFELLGGSPTAILCIQPNSGPLRAARRALSGLERLGPSSIASSVKRAWAGVAGLQEIASLRKGWSVYGENSWDLLEPGIDLFDHAQRNGIPLHIAPLFSIAALERYTAAGPVIFVAYAGGIVSNDMLALKNAEFVNAHMGEMPRFRGMNVIEWAMLEGFVPKVSVMVMNEKIDGGDVIHVEDIPVAGMDTIPDLRRAGYIACAKAMAAGVLRYSRNEVVRQPQPKGGRYYYRMHPALRTMVKEKLRTGTL